MEMAKKRPHPYKNNRQKKKPQHTGVSKKVPLGVVPWFCPTTLKSPNTVFFPSNIYPEAIGGHRLSYKEAQNKPPKFWNDKGVVFHMPDRHYVQQYIKWMDKVVKNAKIAFIKFSALFGATDMVHYDKHPSRPIMCHYRKMGDLTPNFLWELPMNRTLFFKHINKVPMFLYAKRYQEQIQDKEWDFLIFMDGRYTFNWVPSLRLGNILHEDGYKVLGLFLGHNAKIYHNKMKFKTIIGKREGPGRDKFYRLLRKSKIFVDLSYRWTYGRVIYETLFLGAVSVCPSTYGASEHLFPDLIVDTANLNPAVVLNKCRETIEQWTPNLVKKYRNRALNKASPECLRKELNKATKIILDGGEYFYEDK